ncbi:MAG: hypothetical protein JWP00_4361 [Chloroflexi bacterium]|jgi:hypothetical protein|nr:hypothetical protein [Chloroflexota bacterium]
MKQLLPEIEERYGTARSILLPVVVSPHQVEMLRAAEKESEQGWNFLVMIFSGAHLVAEVSHKDSQTYRLPEFRLPADIIDLEDFEVAFREKIFENFGVTINISRYLLLAYCTFMATGQENAAGDDEDTSSRTLHIFTARAVNSDDTGENKETPSNVKLVKPQELLDALQAEWADFKTQLASGGTLGDLKSEYDKSWAFVRVRVLATAFQSLFGWSLPEI